MNATSSVVRFSATICLVVLALIFFAFMAAEVIDWSLSDELPYLLIMLGLVGVWSSTLVALWLDYFRRRTSLHAVAGSRQTD